MKIERKHLWHSLVPYHLRAKSAPDYCLFPKVQQESYSFYNTPVYLNVYDLTPINGYVYWAGVGVFHTGLEINGVEYVFGAHEFSTSGVFEIEPRHCPGFKFREAIYMGTAHMEPIQVREFIEHASANYSGNTYHVIMKNCNHFCEDICYKLTGKRIPKWVNRLANIGTYFDTLPSFFSDVHICCVVSEAHQNSTVRPDPDFQGYDDEKKSLTSSFRCFSSISMPQREREVSISSLFLH